MGNLLGKALNYVVSRPTLKINCWVPTFLAKKSVNMATGLKSSNPVARQVAEYTQQTVQNVKSPFVRFRYTHKIGEKNRICNLRVSAGGQTLGNGSVSKTGDIWKVRASANNGRDFHVSGFVNEAVENTSNITPQFSSMLLDNGRMLAAADVKDAGKLICTGKQDFVSRLLSNAMAV